MCRVFKTFILKLRLSNQISDPRIGDPYYHSFVTTFFSGIDFDTFNYNCSSGGGSKFITYTNPNFVLNQDDESSR